jgi:two-component system cell cycle sensor histidine kinase/response regulator CckA
VRDISARRQLEEQLRQAQKMEAMGTLAGGIAHDFNNLLTAIIGHAELARLNIDEGTLEGRSIDGIVAACRQATGLTRSLLTFSRRTGARRDVVDIAQVARDTLVLLRPLLPAAIRISTEVDHSRPLWVDSDPAQIQQVLMNLTLNARDAMPSGGDLRLTVLRDANEDVLLEVTDTGTGMSDDVRRRITEPFFTTKTRERGTGLGMSVVHGIVTEHRGELEIESVEGEGTTVRVRLRGCEPPPEARITTIDTDSVLAPLLSRVLLVEDNTHVCALLAKVLASNGYGVHTETDGVAALAAYRNQCRDLDLLILDVDLPGMSGTECLSAIRESGGMQPAIVMSGNPDLGIPPEAFGNTRFLQKPFSMERVITTAGELLGHAV